MPLYTQTCRHTDWLTWHWWPVTHTKYKGTQHGYTRPHGSCLHAVSSLVSWCIEHFVYAKKDFFHSLTDNYKYLPIGHNPTPLLAFSHNFQSSIRCLMYSRLASFDAANEALNQTVCTVRDGRWCRGSHRCLYRAFRGSKTWGVG